MQKKNRVAFWDAARAICMLYIVGFWHMQEYTSYGFYSVVTHALTRGVLATFVFISAYWAGQKKVDNISAVITYCKNRLLRIYPLFFLSCTTLYLIHIFWQKDYIVSHLQFIRTLLGVSFIISPAPSTVWFINMIFIFDIISLWVNYFKSIRVKFILCIVIVLCVFVLKNFVSIIDERILIYCPIYCIGLLVSCVRQISEEVNYCKLSAAIILGVGLVWFSEKNLIIDILVAITFIVMILEIGKILSKNKLINRFLSVISYSSMCAYLFHRQVFYAVYRKSGPFSVGFALLVMLPLILIIAFGLQSIYDKLAIKSRKEIQNIVK